MTSPRMMANVLTLRLFLLVLSVGLTSIICNGQYPEPNKYPGFCSDETAFDPVPYTERLNKFPTRLLRAIAKGEEKCVERMLKAGESPNGPEEAEYSKIPLFLALGTDDRIADLLIDHGANLEARGKGGITPLMFAAIFNRGLKQLLSRGVSIDARSKTGMTALMFAASRGTLESVVQLIAAGADVNLMTDHRYTALMLAADDAKLVKALIEAGAKTDVLNVYSLTAACEATKKNQLVKLKTILKYDPASDELCRL